MELRRLQHVVTLADEGHFGRAAERVHLSQPAFSRSIQAAEAELDLKLFDRGAVEARCTPAGAFVVERARRVLHQNRLLLREVDLYREREVGQLAFGAGPLVASWLLPPLLSELRQRHPDVRIRIQVNNPRQLLELVRDEEHDFFVADVREVPSDGTFQVRAIGGQRGGLYARAGHPLLQRELLHFADVAPYGIAAGKLPGNLVALLLRLLGRPVDAELPVAVECNDVHLLKCVALDTDTVVVSADTVMREELAAGRVAQLHFADIPVAHSQLGIVALQGRSLSPLAQFAADRLEEMARQKAEAAPP
jgi:DNA-binding transcriptional LysR family regulator